MAIKQDEDADCLPELCAESLVIERLTRIFSVRMREVVVMEGIEEYICKRESAKQKKVIQGGRLELKMQQVAT